MDRILEHLEDAEGAIMSHISATSIALAEGVDDSEIPDALPMLFAVLRSISRAAGAVEAASLPKGADGPTYHLEVPSP